MYARKLQKNMIDINRRDPIILRNRANDIGSRFALVVICSQASPVEISVVIFFAEALSMSARREGFSFFFASSGGVGISAIV
jgi:hypothetical protein